MLAVTSLYNIRRIFKIVPSDTSGSCEQRQGFECGTEPDSEAFVEGMQGSYLDTA